jgi:hypothetical protein
MLFVLICVSPLQLFNEWTDFYETWYERYAIGRYPNVILSPGVKYDNKAWKKYAISVRYKRAAVTERFFFCLRVIMYQWSW